MFMVGVALIYDGTKAFVNLITFGFLGWIINPFINIWAQMTFLFWFTFLGVSFLKKGKLQGTKVAAMGAPSIVGLIPLVDSLPFWTSGVVTNIAVVYAEDMIESISPKTLQVMVKVAKKASKKKGMGKNIEKQENALDKLNSKKDLDSTEKERLVQAHQIMKTGEIRQGESDPVVLAAYEKYKRGIRVYQARHTVDEKGNFQRDQGYKFSNVHFLGGGQVVHINNAVEKAKRASIEKTKKEIGGVKKTNKVSALEKKAEESNHDLKHTEQNNFLKQLQSTTSKDKYQRELRQMENRQQQLIQVLKNRNNPNINEQRRLLLLKELDILNNNIQKKKSQP